MNILNSSLPYPGATFYYPIGNTRPVCLTQDLPREQSANILLLGCGDARNVLFTCFADNARNTDLTCCDIEPMIHARNVLLYTLFINDEANQNIDLIWNIYYHWKIDESSMKLMESQVQKLLKVSHSIDEWDSSEYGSSIRFCDKRSLSSVRCYWSGFTSQSLSASKKQDWLKKLQAGIDRAKGERYDITDKHAEVSGYHSLFPAITNPTEEVLVLGHVAKKWWDCGVMSSSPSQKSSYLNPVLLYSPNPLFAMHFGIRPLGGALLNTAHVALGKESPFYVESKNMPPTEHLVNCAKSHFKQWALSFRRAIANGSKIRIFSGDALAFCFTLRNCLLTGSRSINLHSDNSTNNPLILHIKDYGRNKNTAPLIFDVIDASNLVDYLGPLNLISLAASLLKHDVSSALYTQLQTMNDSSLPGRINNLLGVDVHSMSMLLGLIPPDLFTNASNSLEEYPNMCSATINNPSELSMLAPNSRLRWKRCRGSNSSPFIKAEYKELAKFLLQVYDAMFMFEKMSTAEFLQNFVESQNLPLKDAVSAYKTELGKHHLRPYNRASFAFLLSVLKTTIITNWSKCLREVLDEISLKSCVRNNFLQDLLLHLHVFGVNSSLFPKPKAVNVNCPILGSIFGECEDLPEQLCVTIRVPREQLRAVLILGTNILFSFEGRDPRGKPCFHSFAPTQIVFGKWEMQPEENNLYLYIEEDLAHISGTSDMFASVMVPTCLLQFESFIPTCGLKSYPVLDHIYEEVFKRGWKLGADDCFFSCEITNKNVFISRFMPGMSCPPNFSLANNEDTSKSEATAVKFSEDGLKVNSLVYRITMETEAAKTKLAMKSSVVELKFKSPLTAVVSIDGSLEFKLEFPVPVSVSQYKLRIARKSLYVEVEVSFFDPLKEVDPSFLFPCFLMKTPCGSVPAPWTSMQVDLDVMPTVDLNNSRKLSWLLDYTAQMFSEREYLRYSSGADDLRIDLKCTLRTVFLAYSGLTESKRYFFSLEDMEGNMKALILPSSLRLDLPGYSVVLDTALIPLTKSMSSDPIITEFIEELESNGLCRLKMNEAENLAWKAMMPALVERCRTWKHKPECEYLETGEVPLNSDNKEWPICSCGLGKFPKDYLKNPEEIMPALNDVLDGYATRAAISPIFASQQVEDCRVFYESDGPEDWSCKCCRSNKRKSTQGNLHSLLQCSKCKSARYCSTACQKADWKKHKPFCKV